MNDASLVLSMIGDTFSFVVLNNNWNANDLEPDSLASSLTCEQTILGNPR